MTLDQASRPTLLHSCIQQLSQGIGTRIEVEADRPKWRDTARPNQLAPDGDWLYWFLLAGRGFGKTRTGAEFVLERVLSGDSKHVTLIGPTTEDIRATMLEGESGLITVAPPGSIRRYNRSLLEVWFENGAKIRTFSMEEPDRLRGPQSDLIWLDEPSGAAPNKAREAWDNAMFGFRLGQDPRCVITGTPKPNTFIRYLLTLARLHVTKGSTTDNLANLSPALQDVVRTYEGTRLGRQELDGELLEDNPDALWKLSEIDAERKTGHPPFMRVVVAVDPAVTNKETSDETGIVVAGLGEDLRVYVLNDLSRKYSPSDMARVAVGAYNHYRAAAIVYESNQGGDFVKSTILTVGPNANTKGVHASIGKRLRAEPVAALYEQGRVSHVGAWPALEDEMCQWNPMDPNEPSPNRVDALVIAITELLGLSHTTGMRVTSHMKSA